MLKRPRVDMVARGYRRRWGAPTTIPTPGVIDRRFVTCSALLVGFVALEGQELQQEGSEQASPNAGGNALHKNVLVIDDLEELVGKRLLVGVTYVRPDAGTEGTIQFVGIVTSVDPLVEIERDGQPPFTLPPDNEAFD